MRASREIPAVEIDSPKLLVTVINLIKQADARVPSATLICMISLGQS